MCKDTLFGAIEFLQKYNMKTTVVVASFALIILKTVFNRKRKIERKKWFKKLVKSMEAAQPIFLLYLPSVGVFKNLEEMKDKKNNDELILYYKQYVDYQKLLSSDII